MSIVFYRFPSLISFKFLGFIVRCIIVFHVQLVGPQVSLKVIIFALISQALCVAK